MKNWLNPKPVPVPTEISEAVGGHPLVSEILVRRGLTDLDRIQAFLDPELYFTASPYELDDMQVGVDRVVLALQERQRICVWGDFDVDGQTSTTLLVSTLRKLGGDVQYHIPLRSKESHGVNLPVLKEIIAGGIDLLLTCDTGISAHEAVNYASSQDVDTIITDHHDLPPELPHALAVINPKRGAAGGNDQLNVSYKISQPTQVTAKIYSSRGRLIKTHESSYLSSIGENLLQWDGRGDDGNFANDGIYVLVIEAEGKQVQKTFVVLNK